ncbi:hypothetical protein BASA81_003927 [Batrachochytrium salamandrivorans]|nr:hypothetical protein BASA81_003927 [Batrachochytrium salamandrivorans]
MEYSLESWYAEFAKHTFPSKIIPLSPMFVNYLKSDGIQLPKPVNGGLLSKRDPRSKRAVSEDGWDEEDGEEEEGPYFEDLEVEITNAIQELGGEVFPKLNFTCPRDAAWMTMGTLDCGTAGEVFLLLKSSDFIQHDLETVQANGLSPVLVLRKWKPNWNPAMEFRCMVVNSQLQFICQRDASEFFPFLIDPEFQSELMRRVSRFAEQVLLTKFPKPTFVFDVYVTPQRIWLVDLAPLLLLGEGSDPHPLVEWDELMSHQTEAVLRIVENTQSRNFAERRALAMHRVPLDLVQGHVAPAFFEGKASDVII